MTSLPSACDLLVIGAGAGGLSCAVTAKLAGLDVVVVEKEPVIGGSMARSGGVLWIPGNPLYPEAGDSREAARTYLRHEAGNFYRDDEVELFLDKGPEMLAFLDRETEVKFDRSLYPDYHPDAPGGVQIGRSVTARPYDASRLGADIKRLRPPLDTITFMGMMFNSSNADLKHFFNVTRSVSSAWYVAKRLGRHLRDLAVHRRGVEVTSGNALAARLLKSAADIDLPIFTDSPLLRLNAEGGRVTGAVVRHEGREVTIVARQGVVLAAGGFSHDDTRLREAFPHVARGGTHRSPTAPGNTGDGIAAAETLGARFSSRFPNAAAWMPVSWVRSAGDKGAFPHLVDRYKPGVIAVLRNGRRFVNEAQSYHDVGRAMIDANEGKEETVAWLIADHATVRQYGLGHAKPAPVPVSIYVANGYLARGRTLRALAAAAGIDPDGLEQTVSDYNGPAALGEDPAFGRGTTAFNRYLGDPANKPNPNVRPIGEGPYYALKLEMGDLGTFDGLETTALGEVVDAHGQPIAGLWAAGNDRASMMGGAYPGAGITLGPIMTFGYVTAQEIARRAGRPLVSTH